jgi:hypothetical protein
MNSARSLFGLLLVSLLVVGCFGAGEKARPGHMVIPAQEWVEIAAALALEVNVPEIRMPLVLPVSQAATGTVQHAVRQLLDPDEAWLCLRSVPGSTVDLRCLFVASQGVLVARGENGLTFSPGFAREEAPTVLAHRLGLKPARQLPVPQGLRLAPEELMVIRTLFAERLQMTRLLGDPGNSGEALLALSELRNRLGGGMNSEIMVAQRPRVRAALAAFSGDRVWIGRVLEGLRQRGVVRRQVFRGVARYGLGLVGDRVAEVLLAPRHRLLISRWSRAEDGSMPLVCAGWGMSAGFGLIFAVQHDGEVLLLPGDLEQPAVVLANMLRFLRESAAVPVG